MDMSNYISHEYGFANIPENKKIVDLMQAKQISEGFDRIEGDIIDLIERESRDRCGNIIYYSMSEHPLYGQYREIARLAAEWRELIKVYWDRVHGAGTFEINHANTIQAKVLTWVKNSVITANL